MDIVILVDTDQHLIPKEEIRTRGFTNHPLPVDHDIATALSKLAQKAWELPTDIYYSTGKRYRTFNKYSAEVLDGKINIQAKDFVEAYVQDTYYNSELGGVERTYEQIDQEMARDVGLCKIMANLIARLPGSRPGQTYDVNLHIMRYCATFPAKQVLRVFTRMVKSTSRLFSWAAAVCVAVRFKSQTTI